MIATHADEPGRLAALRRLQVLDTAPEPEFDRITALVRQVLNVRLAAVSLVDQHRMWVKSDSGGCQNQLPRHLAFCSLAVRGTEPFIIEDCTLDPRTANNPYVTGERGLRCYAAIPLVTADGYPVGTLCALDSEPRQFSAHEVDLLKSFADLVVDQLELRLLATRDALTGAHSRRALIDQAGREISRFRRNRTPASLVLFDVDHLSRVNDAFGHFSGDRVLRAIAGACEGRIRPDDVFARVGGEEFALLLPETGPDEGLLVAERLRAAIADLPPAFDGAPMVTASFGVASLGGTRLGWGAWLADAEVALAEAKARGRNRACGAGRADLAA